MGDQVNLQASSAFRASPKYSFTNSNTVMPDKPSKMPGPGQYQLVDTQKDKFRRSASYTIGGSAGEGKAWGAMPGPGAYSPANPAFASPKWAFSCDSRLKSLKRSTTPGPGAYDIKSTLEGRDTSICSKPERRILAQTPGPGAYNASYKSCSNFESSSSFGFGASDRQKMSVSKTPGPGKYEIPTTLVGNVTMKTPCAYSIKGRYDPPKADQTPGPISAGTTFK
eukprot:TRINITY_DN3233_c0_g1_i1.p1 TRINITY_DN3233_c0_g1~~TRINITY_DN3233_c0_g1_i1.p1  ORF type:complete len:224 (-),score=21.21 TRINITY_DN3233_c0_g1_i1:62-733(-)